MNVRDKAYSMFTWSCCTFVSRANYPSKKKKSRPTQNKDLSHVQALLSRICKDVVRHTSLVRVFRNRSGLIKNTSPFDQQEKRSLTNSGPEWGVIIRPIRTDKTPWAKESSPFSSSEGAEQYCGSAHTSWEQTELPQDSVKKKRKHQYFIKLLSLSGPDQSLDSHSPTGRDGSFVFAPQVEQQSDSVRFWKNPCNAQPIHLAAYRLALGRGGKGKGGEREGENMFQRCPETELLGPVALYCFLFGESKRCRTSAANFTPHLCLDLHHYRCFMSI